MQRETVDNDVLLPSGDVVECLGVVSICTVHQVSTETEAETVAAIGPINIQMKR